MIKVQRVEQGWPGHFISAHRCLFRRNTALIIETKEGTKAIIISTVGCMVIPELGEEVQAIGLNRFYETSAFEGSFFLGSWYADTSKEEVQFESQWSIDCYDSSTHYKANEMHETVVEELALRLQNDHAI